VSIQSTGLSKGRPYERLLCNQSGVPRPRAGVVSILDAVRDCAGYLVGDEGMNEIAEWMMKHGYATGHGESVIDLLEELVWQVAEN